MIRRLASPDRENLAEAVVFSSRIQLLVSKLGRSSKPQPRFLVVVRSSHNPSFVWQH